MHLRSPWTEREGIADGLGGSEEDEEVVMEGLLMRGESGGGVSQPISDTGEPFFTYGVASRMYLTERERKKKHYCNTRRVLMFYRWTS